MFYNRFSKKYIGIMLVVVLSLILNACAAQPSPVASSGPITGSSSMQATETPERGADPALGNSTASFTLKSGLADGKMIFFGVGGDIDGQVNPELRVQPGDIVEIKLINGDGMLHDVAVESASGGEGWFAATEQISGQGKEASMKFKAGEAGMYTYFCSVPGHRAAGMEGMIIVGDAQMAEVATNSIVRAPDDLPGPINRTTSEHIRIDLETTEVTARLADGVSYTFWTFNNTVPGPFIRVREGDTVEVHLKNSIESKMNHSVDFHAVTGPGGGAVATQTEPGGETMFTFKAINPGVYVYHCATPMVAHHITNGMYGLIVVEPKEGLPPVDREFYVMQGEMYTVEDMGMKGENTFSVEKLLDEDPEYFVLNGAVGALTAESPLKAQVGETVRIFFGVGGPNFTSSFHVIGEVFDRVYDQASVTSEPLTNVQTTLVPPGGATVVEFKLDVPGRFILVDHALSRLERGLAGYLIVEGPENKEIYDGPMSGAGH